MSLGNQDLNHADDVGVLAFLEEDDLSQNSACFRESVEEVDDFLDGDVGVVVFAGGFGHISIGPFADDLLDFVIIEVLGREGLVDGVRDLSALDLGGWRWLWAIWLH